MRSRFARQVAALSRKNLLLLRRRRALVIFELLTPVLLIFLLGLMDLAFTAKAPASTATELAHLHSGASERPIRCSVFDDERGGNGYGRPIPGAWCIPILFAPSTPPMMVLMSELALRNGYQSPTRHSGAIFGRSWRGRERYDSDTSETVLGFETVDLLKDFLRVYNGRAAIAYVLEGDSGDVATVPYVGTTGHGAFESVAYQIWYNRSTIVNGW